MLVEAKQMMSITRLQEEIFERYEIKNMVETRMEEYNPENYVSWENIREEI